LEPEEVYRLRLEEEQQARVKAEGFDVMAYDPVDGEACEYSVQGKLRRRWAHFPCGEKPLVRLVFAALRIPLAPQWCCAAAVSCDWSMN
jgi:hypothetical protein